ncbi:MAG: DNA polymerase III subunit gamma/tau [Puniceicoccales bacterium]|jgi:DNA polymerase-3 subunit gamma/tau|nr:DNA polymerase III subunit gamma/tau [Puniceicoccales bacterium]
MAEGTYQVIARRWRPQQFDEIVGQEHIVRTLKNAIETDRIGHAYLFVGPRGTGKTTTARIFARALNCTGGPKISPPAEDPICQAITNGACLDVIEIDAATNRSVEDARKIREECQFAPSQCKFKIFIIDEIHQLSKDAFNALLKTLEEPPTHIKFIFATTEADKLLPTITSRCQRFEFQPIPDAQIAGRLEQIVVGDGVEASRDALLAIARLANGGMRDSQSILDQVISFCGKKVTAEDVSNIYGLATVGEINDLTGAMAAGAYAEVISLSDQLVAKGRDLIRTLQHTQARVREALLAAISSGGQTDKLGAPLLTEQLLRMLETLQAGEASVRGGLSERVNFEVTLLKAVEQSRTRAIDSLIREIKNLAAGLPREAGEKKISLSFPVLPSESRPCQSSADEQMEPLRQAFAESPQEGASYEPRDDAEWPEMTDVVSELSSAEALLSPGNLDGLDAVFADEDLLTMNPVVNKQESGTPLLSVARPGSPDFEKAVAQLPQSIKTLLDDKFHAGFTGLAPIAEKQILRA